MIEEKSHADLEAEIQRLRLEQERLKEELLRNNGKLPQDNGGAAKPEAVPDADAPPKKRTRGFVASHPVAILIGGLALIALAIGGFFLLRYLNSYESTDDAQVDGHLNPVSSRINGTVARVYVQENQFVEAGQLLIELDPSDYKTVVDQANAAITQAQAQLSAENPNVPIVETTNETTISTAEADVLTARAGVAAANQDYQARIAGLRQAEASDAKAQADLKRYQVLIDKDDISRQQFDAVVAAAKNAAAAVDAAAAALQSAQKVIEQRQAQQGQAESRLAEANRNAPRSVAIRQANVAARKAGIVSARAQLEQARLNLSYTKIVAPAAGIVTEKSVEVGQHVQAGQVMLVISQTDDIWITANFKETQLKRMQPGLSADVKIDAFGTTLPGYVESLPGATGAKTSLLPPENATGNYVKVVQRLPVRIRLKTGADSEHRLRPGMSVEPKVWLYSK